MCETGKECKARVQPELRSERSGIERETKGNGKEVCYVDFLAKELELEVMILNTGVRRCRNNEITLDNAKSR